MNKYSVMMKTADKLTESVIEDIRNKVTAADDLNEEEIGELNDHQYWKFVDNKFKDAERTGYSNYSYWGSTLRMFFRNKVGLVTFILLVTLIGFAVIQQFLPGQHDPGRIHDTYECGYLNMATRVRCRGEFDFAQGRCVDCGWQFYTLVFQRNVEPQFFDGDFFLGTNAIGQDVWARIWAGTRNSLIIGFSVAIGSMILGIIFGMLWGYVRQLDFLFTELYNIINNIPTILILIMASFMFRPNIHVLVIAMTLTGWVGHAHHVRIMTLIFRDRDFNLASRCLGTGTMKVIVRNLIPQIISIIMLRIALAIPAAIGSEVFLSYLGLGISVATPTLGNLMDTGRQLMISPELRYQLFIPIAVISVISICFYLAGNAFSDSADPKNHV